LLIIGERRVRVWSGFDGAVSGNCYRRSRFNTATLFEDDGHAADNCIGIIPIDDELSRSNVEDVEFFVLCYLPVVEAEGAVSPAGREVFEYGLAGSLICDGHGNSIMRPLLPKITDFESHPPGLFV
jgi:hypothetical protein